MAALLRRSVQIPARRLACVRAMSGELGDGAGKGGGSGGPIRSAGGSLGKREAAQEEQYFRKMQSTLFGKMKELEVTYHERQIRTHQEAIEHHKKKLAVLKNSDSN